MGDELVVFRKRALIEKGCDALTSGQLSALVLSGYSLSAAAIFGFGVSTLKFIRLTHSGEILPRKVARERTSFVRGGLGHVVVEGRFIPLLRLLSSPSTGESARSKSPGPLGAVSEGNKKRTNFVETDPLGHFWS